MKHVGEKIHAYVAGEMADDEQRAVADHLATCATCAGQADQARDLWARLGDLAIPGRMPAASSWPAIQARTFGRGAGPRFSGGRWWSQTGIAATALAAGVALAVLLPGGGGSDPQMTVDVDETWGSSFWLDPETDASFSTLWLAAADQEGGT